MALNTGTPYLLPYPVPNDIADVPTHVKALAEQVATMLSKKLDATANPPGNSIANYQTKIKIMTTEPAPTAPGYEGDIIFVVS